MAAMMTATLSSCGTSFLELDPSQEIDSDKAILTAADVTTALNGSYYWMGSSSFCGRNLIALPDVGSDDSGNFGYTTHMYSIYNYIFDENDSYVSAIWTAAYKVADTTTRLIVAGEKLLETASESDQKSIKKDLSQAYALRAYATFAVANVYALPYTQENLETPGAVLLHQPIAPLEKVSRSTLKETYEYILEQLNSAAKYANEVQVGTGSVFYMNEVAIAALEARVRLYMGDFENAKRFAQKAIDIKKSSLPAEQQNNLIITSASAYADMFDKTAGSAEDIFVIAKASDDNLSANSINTLYKKYGMSISEELEGLYTDSDIRKPRMTKFDIDENTGRRLYYFGGKYAQPITNIPVIRIPEMYLIIAECEAVQGNASAAAAALFEVAKRDAAIESVDDLPSDLSELTQFIVTERRRELFQEGHRLFDARRRGETIFVSEGTQKLTDGLYLFPIPSKEINAGFGVTQNANWANYMPTPVKN